MKILAIGDFHGKFPRKFLSLIKKEKIDLVVSVGDYLPFHYRDLWFKYCYGTDVELWEVIGKTKYKKLVREDFSRGEKILKVLNKLKVPVITVLGNIDYPEPDDVLDLPRKVKKSMPNWDRKDSFAKILKKYKNIVYFDYKSVKIGDYVFVGMRGHSNAGRVKSKAFKKHRAKLDKLFKRFKKENREGKVIFVSHNVPYDTKLDKINSKEALESVKGKHFGSKLCRRIINRYHPVVAIGGHIHEAKGKQRLGKTLALNTGSASKGEGAVVEINDKGKVKVKFVNL
tara:strand:- start:2329 stop:3183 length:855 start_codon:yes stop_codon:yes gene_type:complete